ncbi:expressed protein [Phakopsora pachyrhizi]|uniref:Expressed protein n=1 Tax=Phakopsora pachyrhizi TaxID=170000 RepID=A0AAV0BAH1_PHAPC|nr:expressed protein [Phakopsora pachyrhizi]
MRISLYTLICVSLNLHSLGCVNFLQISHNPTFTLGNNEISVLPHAVNQPWLRSQRTIITPEGEVTVNMLRGHNSVDQKSLQMQNVIIPYRDLICSYERSDSLALSKSTQGQYKQLAQELDNFKNEKEGKSMEALESLAKKTFNKLKFHHPNSDGETFENAKLMAEWTINRAASKQGVWWSKKDLTRWNKNSIDKMTAIKIGDLLDFDIMTSNHKLSLTNELKDDLSEALKSLKLEGLSTEGSPLLLSPVIIDLRKFKANDGQTLFDIRLRQFQELQEKPSSSMRGANAILKQPQIDGDDQIIKTLCSYLST